ncbi:hypothetical protein B296_00055103 [Ensete ventricosum]|uniref:Auxin efflux carrier component n=1 Tax=Ensete ventricosum TaxID=4639 RepID=A0A426XUT5_ENSVE|nr:hypothetical protein B296_00055103 [Ensete ventricosum]
MSCTEQITDRAPSVPSCSSKTAETPSAGRQQRRKRRRMITAADLYHVLTAVVPLYVAMILAYGSVKWWRIFSPDQCSGINRFVALFAVPLLSFHFISTNNPYAMNYRFIAADTLQKLIVLTVLSIWTKASRRGCLEWAITLFSLSTLPNTLVMGIPLLKGMYGSESGSLMVQIVVLQCIIWYTLMLFLFEYRGARLLIMEQFPDSAGSIISFRVDSDIISLDGKEPLQTEAEVGDDGKLHVTVRKSTSSRSDIYSRRSHGLNSGGISITPRPSNLSNAEIYSLRSSRNPTPRGSSFNHADFCSMPRSGNGTTCVSPRHSNFGSMGLDVEGGPRANGLVSGAYPAPPVAGLFSPVAAKKKAMNGIEGGKDLHMFVWSSSASPVSEGGMHVFAGAEFVNEHGVAPLDDHHHKCEILMLLSSCLLCHPCSVVDNCSLGFPSQKEKKYSILITFNFLVFEAHHGDAYESYRQDDFSFRSKPVDTLQRDGRRSFSKLGSNSTELHSKAEADGIGKPSMPPTSVMTRLILIMVWRKLIRNPNTYSSLLGVIWSLVSFRYDEFRLDHLSFADGYKFDRLYVTHTALSLGGRSKCLQSSLTRSRYCLMQDLGWLCLVLVSKFHCLTQLFILKVTPVSVFECLSYDQTFVKSSVPIYRIVYGVTAENYSLWQFRCCVLNGCQICHWPCCNGCSFYRSRPTWRAPTYCDRTGLGYLWDVNCSPHHFGILHITGTLKLKSLNVDHSQIPTISCHLSLTEIVYSGKLYHDE